MVTTPFTWGLGPHQALTGDTTNLQRAQPGSQCTACIQAAHVALSEAHHIRTLYGEIGVSYRFRLLQSCRLGFGFPGSFHEEISRCVWAQCLWP